MGKYIFIGGLIAFIAGVVGFVFTFTNFGGGTPVLTAWRNVINGFLVAIGITFIIGSLEAGE